jgi:predicted ATP-dependent protease
LERYWNVSFHLFSLFQAHLLSQHVSAVAERSVLTDCVFIAETRVREMIQEGTLLVDVAGERVGQVNGLSVLEIGGYSFGKPVRITASAALGKVGLVPYQYRI